MGLSASPGKIQSIQGGNLEISPTASLQSGLHRAAGWPGRLPGPAQASDCLPGGPARRAESSDSAATLRCLPVGCTLSPAPRAPGGTFPALGAVVFARGGLAQWDSHVCSVKSRQVVAIDGTVSPSHNDSSVHEHETLQAVCGVQQIEPGPGGWCERLVLLGWPEPCRGRAYARQRRRPSLWQS